MFESKTAAEQDLQERAVASLVDEFAETLKRDSGADMEAVIAAHAELAPILRPALLALRSMLRMANLTNAGAGGKQLGDFRILRLIARGGMGEVYEAEQISLSRRVALKLLPEIDSGAHAQAMFDRFCNEARAAAALDHEHIVPIYGFDTAKDRHFIAMKMIDGQSWREHVPTKDWRFAAAQMRDVARALAHAHRRGVIHRDIKPSNLMLDRDAKSWITDFGLASFVSGETLTATGEMLGTLRYMSPEQASAGRLAVDHRSDIYSLGATVYEIVTGVPMIPSQGRAEQLQAIVSGNHIAPKRVNSELPQDLETIILKMVSVEPADRYDTADLVADDLQRLLDCKPILARRMSAAERVERWSRSHVTLVLSAMAAVVVMLASITGLMLRERQWRTRDSEQIRDISKGKVAAEAAGRAATREANRAELAVKETKRHLLESKVALARSTRVIREPGRQYGVLQVIREAVDIAKEQDLLEEFGPQLRNAAVSALAQTDVRPVFSLQLTDGSQPYLDIDSKFEKVVSVVRGEKGEQMVSIRQFTQDMPELLRLAVPFSGQAFHQMLTMRFSPDGNYLAVGIPGGRLVVWNLATQEIVLNVVPIQNFDDDFDFSPDSSHIAVVRLHAGSIAAGVEIYSLDRREKTSSIRGADFRGVRYSPDGKLLLIGQVRSISIHDVLSGENLETFMVPPTDYIYSVAFSCDGRFVAAGLNLDIFVWERGFANRPPVVLRGHSAAVNRLGFHPQDTAILASSSWDNTTAVWNIESGTLQISLPGTIPRFSSDGTRFASVHNKQVTAFQYLPSVACQWLHEPWFKKSGFATSFSSDGRLLVTSSSSSTQIRDSVDGRILARIDEYLHVGFHRQQPILVTAGDTGLYSWPYRYVDNHLHLGPAREVLPLQGNVGLPSLSRDGSKIIWNLGFQEASIRIDTVTLKHRREEGPQYRGSKISPNGQWLAQGYTSRVVVLDEHSDAELANFETDTRCSIAWSPDSSYLLLSSSSGTQFIQSQNWQIAHVLPRGSHVSSDLGFDAISSLAAVSLGVGKIGLCRLRDWSLLVDLESTEPARIRECIDMHPSGSRIVSANAGSGYEFWNMAAIRKELQRLELDWDAQPIATPSTDEPALSDATIDLGEYGYKRNLDELWKKHSAGFVEEKLPVRHTPKTTASLQAIMDMADEALGHFPKFTWALASRAQARSELEQWSGAVTDWQQALQQFPYAPNWRSWLAEALEGNGQFKDAASMYLKSYRESPNLSRANHLLRMACLHPEYTIDPAELDEITDEWLAKLNPDHEDKTAYLINLKNTRDDDREAFWTWLALYRLNGEQLGANDPALRRKNLSLEYRLVQVVRLATAQEIEKARELMAAIASELSQQSARISGRRMRTIDLLMARIDRLTSLKR